MKPRILFILHLPPPVNGAAMVGKYIEESTIINKEVTGDYINLSTSSTVTSIGSFGVKKLFTLLRLQATITKALLSKKYDLCYVTLSASGIGFYKDLFIVTILKAFRCNILYHFHNKGVAIASKKRLNNVLYRYCFRNTQSILLSEHLYSDIAGYVKKADVFYCPNGIKAATDTVTVNNKPDNPAADKKTCRLLFLSNMMAEKGVYILLQACKILKAKQLRFECHFVGAWSDVTEEAFHNAVSAAGLTNYVFAHGKKYGEEKDIFFQETDVFVFPTYYHNECFPLVLLEALSYSLPIITTYEGGIPDIVKDGHNGFLVPQLNVELLADKLELLINNPGTRRQMGRAGYEHFNQHFRIEQFEKKLLAILQTAINRHAAH